MGGRNLATKQYSTGSNPKKESPIFYEARLWRKWANMDDVIRPFASEKEAYDYLTHLRYIAKAGDKITIKRSQDWDVKVLHREVIEEDGQYWATRKPFEPIPTEPLDSVQYSTTVNPETKLTDEQLVGDRVPIPFTPVKRLQRDDILYVTEETRPHPVAGYSKAHKEYGVIDLRGYRQGYEPRLAIKGTYTPNPKDSFRLLDGHLPPYQPTTTGDKLLSEMRRLNIHSASRIASVQSLPQTKTYWVKIKDPGSSSFTKGAVISYEEFQDERKRILERGEKPPSIEIPRETPPDNGNGDKHLPATIEPAVEYLPDSAEFLAETIVATGYREKLDDAFQEAMARVRVQHGA